MEYTVAERIMAGLPSDDASVAAAALDPLATTSDLGTPITVAERAQLQRAQTAGLRVADVEVVARASMPTSFGAAWFDYRDGGRIYVSFTDAQCPSEATLAALRQVSLAEVVAVRAALQATDVRLRALHQEIRQDLLALAECGVLVNVVGRRSHLDAVVVTLDPASASDSREYLAGTYGAVGARL